MTSLSLEAHGKFPVKNCGYYLNVKNGKFVVLNHGKLMTGKLVGDSAALAANAAGTAATTTSAAPASTP